METDLILSAVTDFVKLKFGVMNPAGSKFDPHFFGNDTAGDFPRALSTVKYKMRARRMMAFYKLKN
jgi:hypothetical protein